MGTLLFGKQENIECITNIDVRGPDNQDLCLAFKTSSYFVGAGVYLHDDGYVFGIRNNAKSYVPTTSEELAKLQSTGHLPTPLPNYSVPVVEYAFGYSLWIILAGVAVVEGVRSRFRSRRAAADASTPVSFGPPKISTKADRFVEEQTKPHLAFGETVRHQAYTLTDESGSIGMATKARAHYAVLTDRRLVLIAARVGAFGPLLENLGTRVIDLRSIETFAVADRMIALKLADGDLVPLWVHPTKKLSNQGAFLRDVPRLLASPAPAAASAT